VAAAAERAGWEPAATLTAVLLPAAQGTQVLGQVDPRTLRPAEDLADLPDGSAVLLVPGTGSRTARTSLLRSLRGTDAVVGHAVPWLEAAASYRRALRCVSLDLPGPGPVDADQHLPEILLSADPDVRRALRERVLAPLADLRPTTAEKLTETLRAWLLHQGRRDAVAEALFVHPQTVRYRVGQLREAYGDRLDDPAFVLEATLALG
jgi:DNA-binding PucR family transcriptional regulator